MAAVYLVIQDETKQIQRILGGKWVAGGQKTVAVRTTIAEAVNRAKELADAHAVIVNGVASQSGLGNGGGYEVRSESGVLVSFIVVKCQDGP